MQDLLEFAVNAHGGINQWHKFKGIRLEASIGGLVFDMKGQQGIFQKVVIELDNKAPHVTYTPFSKSGHSGMFSPEYVAHKNGNMIVQERSSPRESFNDLNQESRWDLLHALYFGGYAIWNYLTAPFLFTYPGFQVSEGDVWKEGSDIWRRLHVTFPKGIPTHCSEQTFYFDNAGLLRRLDYHVEILNAKTPVAHYLLDHKEVNGIVIPHRRKAVPMMESGHSMDGPVFVEINLEKASLL